MSLWLFNSTCTDKVDVVAPFQLNQWQSRGGMTPLMLSDALADEKMGKKNYLQVVFWNTRELLKLRKQFLSNLVSNNSLKPSFLYTPSHSVSVTSAPFWCTAVFEQVSLAFLTKTVKRLRPSCCPLDSIPVRLFKDATNSLSPCVVDLINPLLMSDRVPATFRTCCGTDLDHIILILRFCLISVPFPNSLLCQRFSNR